MTLITYRRRAVAMAGAKRFYLAPHIAERPNGDPLKRFVCGLVLYARDVLTGQLPGEPQRYLPQRAERFAREALIPRDEFAALAHHDDPELADLFGVPPEQIRRRRRDLAGPTWPRPRRRPCQRHWCQPAHRRRERPRP
jgi:IrrE N-terminal-like domain